MAEKREIKRGLGFLKEQNEATSEGGGSGLRKMWFKVGERAAFWYLTDAPDAAVPLIHLEERKGGRSGTYKKDVLCAKESVEDETPCRFCSAGVDGPFPRMVMFTFVTDIYHQERGDSSWEVVAAGAVKAYREPVNELRLFVARWQTQDQTVALYGDGDGEGNSGLLSRPYLMTVSQNNQYRNELIEAGDLGPMPPEAEEALANLPDLDDIIRAEFAGGGRRKATTVTAASAPTTNGDEDDGDYEPDDDVQVRF